MKLCGHVAHTHSKPFTNAKWVTNACIYYAYVRTHTLQDTADNLHTVYVLVVTLGGVLMSLANQPIRPLRQNPAVIGWLGAMAVCLWEWHGVDGGAERCTRGSSSCKHLAFSLWGHFLPVLFIAPLAPPPFPFYPSSLLPNSFSTYLSCQSNLRLHCSSRNRFD